ncbi:MAG TPA: type II toxin-antitoxin system PemK/MazF family toxin [Burkholderiales bacterium]|nr:type II toxin-antitoxin system PemK/MazF family toxin [Burkholderiales bacterium]
MAAGGQGWFSPPSPGDIVWCRFPQYGLPGPGPKARPALVLKVGESNGFPMVAVAYGTSKKVEKLYPGEFAILPADRGAFEAAGLSETTKFDLGHTFELDYNDTWFAVPPGATYGQTPKLGILHPSLVRRAKAAHDAAMRASR